MILPGSTEKFVPWCLEIIERCRASAHSRAAQARYLKTLRYTGSDNGEAALLNRMNYQIERTASYLYSPTNLSFHGDFEHTYGKQVLEQAEIASRVLTRQFERRDIDIQFGEGVDTALTYGACIPKLVTSHGGITCNLINPWQIGVYREDKNDLSSQEAIVETNYITPYDLWRRISHLPNAIGLFNRARSYAKKNATNGEENTYLHQILLSGSSPIIQAQGMAPQPGGIVQTGMNYTGGVQLDPAVLDELIAFHELWVIDDERGDYTTIQIAEPDILIAPRLRRRNMFVDEYLPYGLIQPNRMAGNIWGRPELADLVKLQYLLRDRMEDIKKLMGLQYDRLFAFMGSSGMNDEQYDQFREAGWLSLEPGSDVKDLTPKVPEKAFEDIQQIMTFMDEVAGFSNVLSGQGEPGVRAGNHAQMLLRTASPHLRDRALLVERQCADLGDKVFQALAAKYATTYQTSDGQDFLLSQLPDDLRWMVDSHSSSPIYEEDHMNVAAFLSKSGIIDGESTIDLMPLQRKDMLKQRFREKEAAKAQLLKEHPELLQQQGKGGRSHH